MNTLRIIATGGEGSVLRWLRLVGGEVFAQGEESSLARLEDDDTVELILPCERVALIRVPISVEQQSRLSDDNLPWLVESRVIQDAERLHIVRGEQGGDGFLTVAVVDRVWLQGVCAKLVAASIRPQRIISEIFVGPWRAGEWKVVLCNDGGWLRLGRQSALALDRSTGGEVPATLQLALSREQQPERIVVYGDARRWTEDCAQWGAGLGVPVQFVGEFDWSAIVDGDAIDLARGPFSPPGRADNWWLRVRRSVWLMAGVLAVNAAGWTAYGVTGALERGRLEQAIGNELLSAFPDTKVVLDPLLQMRQGVDRLARGSGASMSSDLLPLLGRVVEASGGRLAGKVESIEYEPGKLNLEIGQADPGEVEVLRTALKAGAINFRIEPLSASAAVPVRIRLSVTP